MPAPSGSTLIDRVDAQNRPIGLVSRAEAFDERANFRTVHVLVTNAAGDVLVQRLATNRERHAGAWGSSVAGYLYAGESYLSGASRRLHEELDVRTELTFWGVLAVADESVTKFVGVFSGCANHPRIAEPDHTSEIKFKAIADIERDLEGELSTYTDTFKQVFAYWVQRRQAE